MVNGKQGEVESKKYPLTLGQGKGCYGPCLSGSKNEKLKRRGKEGGVPVTRAQSTPGWRGGGGGRARKKYKDAKKKKGEMSSVCERGETTGLQKRRQTQSDA